MSDSLDDLLAKLTQGDARAAEQVFLTYEPILRRVVRRQLPARLRAKFDSIDIVQSVWADMVQGLRDAGWRFADVEHLRAFLVKMTRNRFIDRIRHHRPETAHQRPLGEAQALDLPCPSSPRPSQLAQADELWDKIMAVCPPMHHELLRLKRQGLSAREIAARTGLHEDSIHRILRGLARQLALELEPVPFEQ
jgi:RNA polymerase sigma-70 factor (ECF subfamily)